jgi:hypothetical protein
MTTKNSILILTGALLVGGILYLTVPKRNTDTSNVSPISTTKEEVSTKPPALTASTEEIIDYLTDSQLHDTTHDADSVLTSQESTLFDASVSTNF